MVADRQPVVRHTVVPFRLERDAVVEEVFEDSFLPDVGDAGPHVDEAQADDVVELFAACRNRRYRLGVVLAALLDQSEPACRLHVSAVGQTWVGRGDDVVGRQAVLVQRLGGRCERVLGGMERPQSAPVGLRVEAPLQTVIRAVTESGTHHRRHGGVRRGQGSLRVLHRTGQVQSAAQNSAQVSAKNTTKEQQDKA